MIAVLRILHIVVEGTVFAGTIAAILALGGFLDIAFGLGGH